MVTRIVSTLAIAFVVSLLFAANCRAAGQQLGFEVQVEGGGFFLNPVVTAIRVTQVTKGAIADAAGMRAGDLIIQIQGENVAGKRALELRRFMQMDPGETRTLRLRHSDGAEVDVRITKPKG